MDTRVRQYIFYILLLTVILVLLLQPEQRPVQTVTTTPTIEYIVVEAPRIAEHVAEVMSTAPSPIEPDVDEDELQCLAKNIYHEARGESWEGKLAVAWVTLNRVHSGRFPDTICDVVYQAQHSTWWLENHGRKVPVRNKCQFSWYCDGKSDRIQLTTLEGEPIVGNVNAWTASQDVALKTMLGITSDNTKGATFYYNPKLADPYWKTHFVYTVMVGDHKFMKIDHI